MTLLAEAEPSARCHHRGVADHDIVEAHGAFGDLALRFLVRGREAQRRQRMELGDKWIPVKNIYVPLWFKGRRWGNFELAYRDD